MGVSDPALRAAAAAWQDGRGWAEVHGDALAWVAANTIGEQPALIVVDEPDAAERVLRALRFFLADPSRVEPFPADDTKPYDGFSPSPDLPGQRARTLYRLDRGDPVVVVAPVRALLQHIPNAAARARATRVVQPGDVLDRDDLLRHLTATGYLAAPSVTQPGTFAARGDVVDVWVHGQNKPRRIDLFDDEVEKVREVDPRSGRAGRAVKRAVLLPAREELLDAQAIEHAAAALTTWAQAQDRGVALRRRVIEDLKAQIRFSGLEDWLPALGPTEPGWHAFRALRAVAVHPGSLGASARDVRATAARRWAELDADDRPLPPPEARYDEPEALLDWLDAHALPVYEHAGAERAVKLGLGALDGYSARGADLSPIAAKLHKLIADDRRVALVARDARGAEMLEQLLEPYDLHPVGRASPDDLRAGELSMLVGELSRGFLGRFYAVIPASVIFGQRDTEATRRAHALFGTAVTTLSDLKDGDPVVHRTHGIGRFRGLQRIEMKGGLTLDFARIEYRDGDLLFLPATELSELSRYTGSSIDVDVKLDKLGGGTWARKKADVRDALLEKAQQLLSQEARRKLTEREPWNTPGPLYRTFVARFPHHETPDQARAIVDVQDDLSSDAPMDRLVCGDVGFGKTEVAMRAVMRVVEGGGQAAVMCPTTVLAFQHLLTFRDRFGDLPVKVGMLSRFSTPKEAADVLAGLADGSLDVVVGTHRLLSREVRFQRLGLVVIDEEHRFGVTQKEKLKALRTDVDVLSMSATPIPRSLQLALAGARQMSIMATPPEERLEIRTMVARMSRTRVRDAILLELSRQGQVYVIHNRIESLGRLAEQIGEWVPEARIRTAHGQMTGEQIEQILLDFMHKRFDVLVCTAIVESGVDLPNVNTMIIDRADLFGLSQLYQLRGRVGRGQVRGSCLLLTPEEMTAEARRRVQVLVDNTRLGAGFSIAAADLDLRGGGNLLGDAQSGHIDAVGIETWSELLEEAIRTASGEAERERIEPVVEAPVSAFLPEALLPDVPHRLGWYRRLAAARTTKELQRALGELETEVGELPAEVHRLGELLDLKLACRTLGITRLEWLKIRALAELHPATPLKPDVLDRAVAAHPKRFAVGSSRSGVTQVSARFTPEESEKPLRFMRWFVARLEGAIKDGER